jgi:hypothetical protein
VLCDDHVQHLTLLSGGRPKGGRLVTESSPSHGFSGDGGGKVTW